MGLRAFWINLSLHHSHGQRWAARDCGASCCVERSPQLRSGRPNGAAAAAPAGGGRQHARRCPAAAPSPRWRSRRGGPWPAESESPLLHVHGQLDELGAHNREATATRIVACREMITTTQICQVTIHSNSKVLWVVLDANPSPIRLKFPYSKAGRSSRSGATHRF